MENLDVKLDKEKLTIVKMLDSLGYISNQIYLRKEQYTAKKLESLGYI